MSQPASLDGEIAAAEARVAALRARKEAQAGPWPKRVILYVHGSKESNYDRGVELGLTGEGLETFLFITYEVALEYEVSENGEGRLVACDGQPIQPKAGRESP